MNRFAIYSLLALFRISFAPAQAGTVEFGKIRTASIDPDDYPRGVKNSQHVKESQTFNQENLSLYKTDHVHNGETIIMYSIRNSGKKLGPDTEFEILPRSTIVTKDAITVRWLFNVITLIMEEDHFEFYRKVFPHDEIPHPLPVKTASKDKETWHVTTLETVKIGDWVVEAVDGTTPRLIFPVSSVMLDLLMPSIAVKSPLVNFTIKTKKDMNFSIEFDEISFAQEFYALVTVGDLLV